MELQGQVVPSTEAEWEFLQRLYEATAEAHEAGVGDEEIVLALSFAAASINTFGDEGAEPPEGSEEITEPREDCPSCGGNIEQVRAFIGGEVEVDPCGCFVEHTLVQGWLEQ